MCMADLGSLPLSLCSASIPPSHFGTKVPESDLVIVITRKVTMAAGRTLVKRGQAFVSEAAQAAAQCAFGACALATGKPGPDCACAYVLLLFLIQ